MSDINRPELTIFENYDHNSYNIKSEDGKYLSCKFTMGKTFKLKLELMELKEITGFYHFDSLVHAKLACKNYLKQLKKKKLN